MMISIPKNYIIAQGRDGGWVVWTRAPESFEGPTVLFATDLLSKLIRWLRDDLLRSVDKD